MVCFPSCILKLDDIGEMDGCGKIAVSFPVCVPPKRKSEIALRGSDSEASGVASTRVDWFSPGRSLHLLLLILSLMSRHSEAMQECVYLHLVHRNCILICSL